MLDDATRAEIRAAFEAGNLKVLSVDPQTGLVHKSIIGDVLKHTVPKRMLGITLDNGAGGAFTEDHSVFFREGTGITPVQTGALTLGDGIAIVSNDTLGQSPMVSCQELGQADVTYDLSIPGHENFCLANGILAHNSYSIGGVSLELERSSKYESLKQNSEGQFDKATEAKARTVKFMRGLQQPKYGIGIRSSFGPNVGRGVLSPRGFL